MTRTAFAVALALTALAPAPARAYLIDLNDATVVGHGRMALELQPIGYYQTLIGDEDHELVVPSFQLYWGFAPDWDVLYVARGYAILDDVPDEQSRYAYLEQTVAFRAILRHGAYSSDDAEGPSVVFQGGLMMPGVDGDEGFGATAALLVSESGDAGTLHGNVWTNLTRDPAFELFVSVVYEAPDDWPARPTGELYFDLYDGEPYVSGLLGVVVDVTDDFLLQGGVRVGGWDGYADMEVRLSSWIEWEVWDPAAGSTAAEPRAVTARSPLARR